MPDCVDNGSEVKDDPRTTRTSQYVWWQSSAFLLGFIWLSQQFIVCSVLSGWSTVNCGVGRKLPAPQHPATSAPTPPSQPSIRDLSHNPILPCFISSSPIVVFPQSPLLYLFRWLLCSSATVFVFVQPLPYFQLIWALCLFFHSRRNPIQKLISLDYSQPMQWSAMNPSIQTLVADVGLKSESTGPLLISDNPKKK